MCDWCLFWVYWLHNSQIMKNCCRSLNHFSVQKSAHGETSVCVKNISNLSAWRRFRKSIFSLSMRAFPEDNKFDCFHTHRKFVLVLACSAVFHMVFPTDGTLMVTQLWSMCPYQYFSLAARLPLWSLFPLLLISQSIRDKLEVSLLLIFLPPSLLLEKMPNVQFTLAHMRTDIYIYGYIYLDMFSL